jgi:hypothetical protein
MTIYIVVGNNQSQIKLDKCVIAQLFPSPRKLCVLLWGCTYATPSSSRIALKIPSL